MGINLFKLFSKKRSGGDQAHTWKLVAKTYARPRLDLSILEILSSATLEKALFGVTTTVWENELGETRRDEFLGSDETVLDDLLDKATQYGGQIFERGAETFVVSKWTPPTAPSTGNLPLRS